MFVSSKPLTTQPIAWVSTQEMATRLGISIRALYTFRTERNLFVEGRHYRRQTPRSGAPLIWNSELATKAWEAEIDAAKVTA